MSHRIEQYVFWPRADVCVALTKRTACYWYASLHCINMIFLLTVGNHSHNPLHRFRDWIDISHHPHVLRSGLLGASYHVHRPPAR